MAANGNFSVFVVRPFLLHRSRARSPKPAGGELMAAPARPSRVSAPRAAMTAATISAPPGPVAS